MNSQNEGLCSLSNTEKGFSLVELLIALALMGTITVFTISKLLNVTQANDYKWRIQMAASMISGAYARYQQDNTVTTGMKPSDLTPYMNYVKFISNSSVSMDNLSCSSGGGPCSGTHPCVQLHNGALLRFWDVESFGSLAPGYAIIFQVDADNNASNDNQVELHLYATNGRVATRSEITNPTLTSSGSRTPNASCTPSWFSWN